MVKDVTLRVVAKNFLSWKELDFSIVNGITLIDGWNEDDQTEEGSGKSAVLNALSWGLYGKIPKEANVDDVIKTGEKGCEVRVVWSNFQSVVRSRKPNDLYMQDLTSEDKAVLKGKDARETQKMIEDFVGLSFEAFCQSIYFAQNYDKKFITANQEDKAKILSEIQDLQIFDRARKETLGLLKIEKDSHLNLTHQVQLDRSQMENLANQIKSQNEMKVKVYENHKFQIDQLERTIDQHKLNIEKNVETMKALASQLKEEPDGNFLTMAEDHLNDARGFESDLKSKLKDIDSHNRRIFNLRKDAERYAKEYQDLEQKLGELQAFIQNPVGACPTCGTELKDQDTTHARKEVESIKARKSQIEINLGEISQSLKEGSLDEGSLREELQVASKAVSDAQATIKEAEVVYRGNESLRSQIQAHGKVKQGQELALKQYEDQLTQLKDSPPTFDESTLNQLMDQARAKAEEITSKEDLIKDKEIYINRLEQLKSGFKEVKSFVFNSALTEINMRANQYLEALFEVPAQILMTNEDMKIRTQIMLDGEDRGLGLLSGGQFRRFSLAVDLALSDVVLGRSDSKLNIMALDEYFKDLSEISMNKALELLKKRSTPVIMIEHNSIFKSVVDNTFNVRLENGTSYLQEQ